MNTITLSREAWRTVITVLREKALPYMLEHAEHLERLLDQHPAGAVVRLSLTDDLYLRSYNWACRPLGIPLRVDGEREAQFPRRNRCMLRPSSTRDNGDATLSWRLASTAAYRKGRQSWARTASIPWPAP